MAELVHYEVRNRVAVLTVDNPPVNAMGPGVLEGIEEQVARANGDAAVDAIVLIGAGTTFVAGADIKIFGTLKTREQSLARSEGTHARLKRIEDSLKPLVAAIHGNALGGGLEIAMSCHYRVMAPDARVGQPEVLLGIIPGAGGTQRLPRLCGAELAIQMCTDGKPVKAAAALSAGIVDKVAGAGLLDDAIAFAQWKAGQVRKTRERSEKIADRDAGVAACNAARAALAKTAKGVKAPFKAVDAIEGAFTLDFEAGSARERELFADCVTATESRALVHMFFADREAAKVPDIPKDTPIATINQAAVIGAGTMGGGIAMAYANAGIPVILKDVDDAAVAKGLAIIRKNYESTVAKGRMSAEQLEQTMSLIVPTTTYQGFETVDIVVEAAFEDMELKKQIFADLGRITKPSCILASNTSTLDIDEFAKASGRPQQVIGHHFFSPANVMKLLEIVRGKETSKEVVASSLALAKRLGKVGVVVGNCFAFVANRMIAYYMREALLLLEEGATVPQVDRALTEFGMPVGPFGMQDIAGIDVGWRIRQFLKSIGKTRAEGPQSAVPDRLYEMGRYGQKTGAGWYKYEKGSRERIHDPLVDQIAAEEAAKRGVTRRKVEDSEIISRIMTALANEGAKILEEGYATRASDIDAVYCYGFGYPRHVGGPMFYADTVGLPEVLAKVKDYRARFGDYWQPAALLEKLAADGRGFHG
jgi:3-hydroxyacyl-CoA dehydrogenase